MKLKPQKPNTKPIFILPKKYQYLTKFYETHTQDSDQKKNKKNTNKFMTEIPNTDLVLVFSWYTKFLVTD